MEAGKGIYSKLSQVLAKVNRVPKNGMNNFHHYAYATESDLSECIRPALAEANVAFIPTVVKMSKEGDATSVEMDFTFADGDSGEAVTVKFFGEAQDKGDKGVYKAYTGAVKYCLMKMFLIPTGDDPEDDGQKKPEKTEPKTEAKEQKGTPAPVDGLDRAEQLFGGQTGNAKEQPKAPCATEMQTKAIYAISNKIGMDEANLKKLMADKYHKESSKELTKAEASDLITYLKTMEE